MVLPCLLRDVRCHLTLQNLCLSISKALGESCVSLVIIFKCLSLSVLVCNMGVIPAHFLEGQREISTR